VIERFKREAQAAGRLNHPNIVSVYEYGEDQGIAYIAMEFIVGGSSGTFDRGERFPIPRRCGS
jgi:serine/threonine-protein kinase